MDSTQLAIFSDKIAKVFDKYKVKGTEYMDIKNIRDNILFIDEKKRPNYYI
ncbi:hypothetical protein [Providencia sp. PROV064]|uniref:hypothetical protein n=1 Tax=Providencia sp. PROV064 TaxID=2949790 RepID=UPI00234A72F5|nr:hypothetical protein [Providencia sp. PROV064]